VLEYGLDDLDPVSLLLFPFGHAHGPATDLADAQAFLKRAPALRASASDYLVSSLLAIPKPVRTRLAVDGVQPLRHLTIAATAGALLLDGHNLPALLGRFYGCSKADGVEFRAF
jgi:hypothetical protein